MKTICATLVNMMLATFLLTARLQAQDAAPSPERAPMLLAMLDQNGDKRVSRDEAQGALKARFAFVDSNGDGGIELAELRRALQLASGQKNLAKPVNPSYGTLNEKQWSRMQSLPSDEDGEFWMVNLIKYREKAKYADGRKTDLTGEQADALYAPIDLLAKIGAEVAYLGRVSDQLNNSQPRWDRVAIVRYPSRSKFLQMVTNPKFQARSVHKDAGLAVSQVLVTERLPGTNTTAKQEADKDDAFTLVQLVKYRKTAKFPNKDGVQQKRSGKEAMTLYRAACEDPFRKVGAKELLRTSVEGVLIGDGRSWDEFRLLHFPSQAAYSEASQAIQDATQHLDAAIEDSYVMKVRTMLPLRTK